MVYTFALDKRTVARWHERAGQQYQNVHESIVMHKKLSMEQVQAEVIRGKRQRLIRLVDDGDHGLDAVVERQEWSTSIGIGSSLIDSWPW